MPDYRRKHYEDWADIIKGLSDPDDRRSTVEICLRLFISDNKRFNSERFLTACGLEPDYHLKSLVARLKINRSKDSNER